MVLKQQRHFTQGQFLLGVNFSHQNQSLTASILQKKSQIQGDNTAKITVTEMQQRGHPSIQLWLQLQKAGRQAQMRGKDWGVGEEKKEDDRIRKMRRRV